MAFTAADMIVHVGADVGDAIGGLGQVGSAVDRSGAGVGKATLLMGGLAAGVAAGFGMAIGSAMNFEGAMADVSASLSTTSAEYDKLSTLALNIGRDTAFSATQGAQAIEELGKAGVSITDILNGAGMAAAQLASATGSDIPTAANVMANALNVFNLTGADSARVADVMTAALNESSLSMSDFAMGMAQGGQSAAAAGMSIEQTAAALAIFSNAGMSGSDAGTALKNMLASLATPTADAAAWFERLGINMQEGIDSGDLMGYTAEKLKTGLQGMGEAERMAALETMFGADAMRVANILYGEGAAGVAEMNEKMISQGQAAEAAKRRLGGLRGALEQLKGSVETAFILFGSMLTPAITRAATGITKLVNVIISLPQPFKAVIGVVAGVIGGIAALSAGFGVLMMASGPLTAGFGALVAGLSAILAPALLVAGVALALYVAWQTNFGGIRDIVTGVLDTVLPLLKMLGMAMMMVGTSTGNANVLISLFPDALQPAIRQIFRLVDSVQVLVASFQNGGLMGLLEALPGQLARMGDAFGRLGEIIWDALAGLPWGEIGATLWSGLVTVAGYAADFALTLLGYLGDLTAALGGWLWEKASAVDWAGILSSAASVAGDIAGTIVSGLGDLGLSLAVWLMAEAAQVNWGGILSSAAALAGDITGTIVSKIGDLGMALKTWYDNAINSVDWSMLGVAAGQGVGNLADTLGPKALELIQGFGTWLTNNWQTIGLVLAGLFLGLPALIGYIGMTLAPKAAEFVNGFITGLGTSWPEIGAWLASVPMKLHNAIGSLAATLIAKGFELLQGLMTGLIQNWPSIQAWLFSIGAKALSSVGSLMTTLLSRGLELIAGMGSGIAQAWPGVSAWLATVGKLALAAVGSLVSTLISRGLELLAGLGSGIATGWSSVSSWLATLGTLIFNAVGSLVSTLLSRGNETMTGLSNGIISGWANVSGWLAGLPGYAAGAVGDMSAALFNAGNSLMSGLSDGILAGWENIKGLLGSLNPADYKGPPERDRQMLVENGLLTMQGYREGLARGWRLVTSDLTNMVPDLSAGSVGVSGTYNAAQGYGEALGGNLARVGAHSASQGHTVINYHDARTFTVAVDDLQDVAEAVEVIRDLQRDHELVYGAV